MSGLRTGLLLMLVIAQVAAGIRVAARLGRTARGDAIARRNAPLIGEFISVIVPVLDERARLAPCLEGLMAQPAEVGEILLVDGGSRDGTQDLVQAATARDRRIRLVDASPVPAGWNGKAHGLHIGLRHADPASDWILTLDADVRPDPALARSLVAYCQRTGVDVLGVATQQVVADSIDAVVHPAMLTTLVYRQGIPGQVTQSPHEVQANGQCSLFRRAALEESGGFTVARASRCEDVTLARALAHAGHRVGFAEAPGLVEVAMYGDWRETWGNWPRSLTLRDRYAGWRGWRGLADVTLAQGLPLAMLTLTWLARRRDRPTPPDPHLTPAPPHFSTLGRHPEATGSAELTGVHAPLSCHAAPAGDASRAPFPSRSQTTSPGGSIEPTGAASRPGRLVAMDALRVVNLLLLAMRLGILAGTRRAYLSPPVTYWLSPLADLPVSLRLWQSARQRTHTWRGRPLVPDDIWSVT